MMYSWAQLLGLAVKRLQGHQPGVSAPCYHFLANDVHVVPLLSHQFFPVLPTLHNLHSSDANVSQARVSHTRNPAKCHLF
jgi:hypothetical protein